MIQSFRHQGLARLWNEADARGVPSELLESLRRRLTALDAAGSLRDLQVPGWRLHRLHGRPIRHALAVNGPWRLTFEWEEGDAWRLDLEQYH
jgi:proteic killer suppression protein